jgi:diguanylate cyclase (GGDEF)-like protein
VTDSPRRTSNQEGKIGDSLGFANVLMTATMEACADGILVVDASARIRSFNRHFIDMWKVPRELLEAGKDELMLQVMISQVKNPSAFLERMRYQSEGSEEPDDDELETLDGRTIHRHSAGLRNADNLYLGRIWHFRDISELKVARQQIAALASSDPLTGLANRGAFLDRLDYAFATAGRDGKLFAVLYLDLDRFRAINNRLGHSKGDAVLRSIAGRLTKSIREIDLAARFGRDEFAILLNDPFDIPSIGVAAQKIASAVAEPCTIDGVEVRSTASIGIAPYLPEVQSSDDLLKQAAIALGRAKDGGRDRVCFHSVDLDYLVPGRDSLAEDLRLAIERNELDVHFQPQVAISSGEIVGMEALARWQHPLRGMVPPALFIPAAEKSNVIVQLGHLVRDRACEQFKRWRDEGFAPPVVSVNVAAAELKLGDRFLRDVQDTLTKWGMSASDLELDVTEEIWIELLHSKSNIIERLAEIGVGIAIDDFGSDGGLIGNLHASNLRRLKISPQLIEAMSRGAADAEVVRTILALAGLLGIEATAESVETEAQRAFLLSSMATVRAQGYLYSRPVPADEARELLRRREIVSNSGNLEHHPNPGAIVNRLT